MAHEAVALAAHRLDERAAVAVELAAHAPQVDVELTFQELRRRDIRDRLVTADPAGEGPDIIIGAHDWLGALVSSGVVAPIDLSGVAGDITDVAISAFTYEGKTYGVPYAIENIALIRNTDLPTRAELPCRWRLSAG